LGCNGSHSGHKFWRNSVPSKGLDPASNLATIQRCGKWLLPAEAGNAIRDYAICSIPRHLNVRKAHSIKMFRHTFMTTTIANYEVIRSLKLIEETNGKQGFLLQGTRLHTFFKKRKNLS
jgi:hypothetical protein